MSASLWGAMSHKALMRELSTAVWL